MKWFKSKQDKLRERQVELNKELEYLNNKYSELKNCFCKSDEYIFIFRYFEIEDDCVKIVFNDFNTTTGYVSTLPASMFFNRLNTTNLINCRTEWVKYKENMFKLGIKMEIIKEK